MKDFKFKYSESQIYEYIERVFFYNVVLIYGQMPRKNEFIINMTIVYLRDINLPWIKNKKKFL